MRYALADWTPDNGDIDHWLARWADQGWTPRWHAGVECVINGRNVVRWAMVRADSPDAPLTHEAPSPRW